jgi:hypothetical protein
MAHIRILVEGQADGSGVNVVIATFTVSGILVIDFLNISVQLGFRIFLYICYYVTLDH